MLAAMSDASTIKFGDTSEQRAQFLDRYPDCCTIKRTAYWWPFSGELGWGLYEIEFMLYGPYNHSIETVASYKTQYPFGKNYRLSTGCKKFSPITWTDTLEQIPTWFQSK
jgi:hypothetical protein